MCHSRESGNPDRAGSRIKCGMTEEGAFPRKRESRSNWIPSQAGDDKECVIPVKTGIQSEWIPHQVRDDKECVIPAQAGIQAGLDPQSEALRFRLRTA